MFNKNLPYNDLPDLPIRQVAETLPILRLLGEAKFALGELNGYGQTLPNPQLLIEALVLQEAQISTEIENIVTTQDALYRQLALPIEEELVNPETKEVFRYREALFRGLAEMQKRPLSTNVFVAIQNVLKETNEGIRKGMGTQLAGGRSGAVIYTPPQGEDIIRGKLKNLEDYLHDPGLDTDPLIRMAVAHYQFEAIHPFTDGNGRTGRILNVLYLIEAGLLREPILYLSAYFLRHRRDYYRLLRQVTEAGDFEAWIAYVLKGVKEAAVATKAKIETIVQLMNAMSADTRKALGSRYRPELLALIFERPYCRIEMVRQKLRISRPTATALLNDMFRAGVLDKETRGRIDYYLNKKLLRLLGQPLI